MLDLSALFREAAASGASETSQLAMKESLKWAEKAAASGDGRGVYTLASMLEETGGRKRREAYKVGFSFVSRFEHFSGATEREEEGEHVCQSLSSFVV